MVPSQQRLDLQTDAHKAAVIESFTKKPTNRHCRVAVKEVGRKDAKLYLEDGSWFSCVLPEPKLMRVYLETNSPEKKTQIATDGTPD